MTMSLVPPYSLHISLLKIILTPDGNPVGTAPAGDPSAAVARTLPTRADRGEAGAWGVRLEGSPCHCSLASLLRVGESAASAGESESSGWCAHRHHFTNWQIVIM
jgi:hypothetical protein